MTSEGDLWVLVLLRYAQQLLTSTSVEFAVEFSDEVGVDGPINKSLKLIK